MVYVWVCRMVSVCVGVCDGWCMCGCVGWLEYVWGVGRMVYVWVCGMVSICVGVYEGWHMCVCVCRIVRVCVGV